MTEFVFESMTPALRAAIDHQAGLHTHANTTYPTYRQADMAWEAAGRPDDGPLKAERDALYERHYGGIKAYRDETKRLRALVEPGLLKSYAQAQKRWLCRDEVQVGDAEEHRSPSGRHGFRLTSHATGQGSWGYTKAKVFCVVRGVIAEVCRNYHAFPFAWVEGHPNGHDYLVCGEHYQGITVIELDTGRRADLNPPHGFCWVDIMPSPRGTMLGVRGCHWACAYETILYDFSQPLNLPFLEWGREDDHLLGWIDEQTAKLGHSTRWSKTYQKHERDLTREEQDAIETIEDDEEDTLWEERLVERVWTKPPLMEHAKEFIVEQLEHWKRMGVTWEHVRDRDAIIIEILRRLTPAGRQELRADATVAALLDWHMGWCTGTSVETP